MSKAVLPNPIISPGSLDLGQGNVNQWVRIQGERKIIGEYISLGTVGPRLRMSIRKIKVTTQNQVVS